MTRFFTVEATFRTNVLVELDDDTDHLEGEDLEFAALEQVDSSTAELVDWELTEVQNDAR